jgi:uncharacterized short protein YbdD (DUF466 family)
MRRLEWLWCGVRRLAGEDAYAQYCAHLRTHHPEQPVPTAKEFYLQRIKDKYARPSRCC